MTNVPHTNPDSQKIEQSIKALKAQAERYDRTHGVKEGDGFRKCEFCGCNTNAKVRACCEKGRAADGVEVRPAFDPTKPCVLTTADPTRTYCERCKNPHHACDHGTAGVEGTYSEGVCTPSPTLHGEGKEGEQK